MSLFLESASVSVNNASTTVTVTGSVNCSQVYPGTGVLIDNILVEGIAGTASNGSGVSTITLSKPWAFPNKSAVRLVAFNTIEGMGQAIRMARDAAQASAGVLQSFDLVLSSTAPTVEIDLTGVPINVVPYGYLTAQSVALIGDLEAATGAIGPLQADIAQLEQDVAAQQGIVNANLTASNNAASTATNQATIATNQAGLALNRANDAATAKTQAEAQVALAAAQVALAAQQATLAAGSATTAGNHASTANDRKNDAAASATLAQAWAVTPENTFVPGTSSYSAVHHAAKAQYWAGQAAGAAAGALVYAGQYNASSNTFPASPTSGQVYEISVAGSLSGFENISGTIAVTVGDRITKTATGWTYQFGGAQLRGNGVLPLARGGTNRSDGKAPELITSRNFSISGKATAATVGFTGAGNVVLNVTAITATIAEVTGLQAALDDIEALAIIGMMR
jgi:hypothetical protein